MNNLSARNKLIFIASAWLLVSTAMLVYGFNFLDVSNQQAIDAIAKQKVELQTLRSQNQSYLQAKSDLEKLAMQPVLPEEFFSQDVTLVKELEILEALKQKFNVVVQFSGVSGTVKNLARAKTSTLLGTVPFSVSVIGAYNEVLAYMETLQNLSFITNITNVAISAADSGKVNASMSGNFYVKK